MYNSLGLNVFTQLCKQSLHSCSKPFSSCRTGALFSLNKNSSFPLLQPPHHHTSRPVNGRLTLGSSQEWNCAVSVFLRLVYFISLMLSRFIPAIAFVRTSFLFKVKQHSIVCISHIVFTHRLLMPPPFGCCKEHCPRQGLTSTGHFTSLRFKVLQI